MKERMHKPRTCPKCGQVYTNRPAVSREDNSTMICPDCETREALASLGISAEEQNQIIGIIHGRSQPE